MFYRDSVTPLQTIGVFAGIPVALFILITVLVLAPGWIREARYRPDLEWTAEPEWLEGPAHPSGVLNGGSGSGKPKSEDTGGASARW